MVEGFVLDVVLLDVCSFCSFAEGTTGEDVADAGLESWFLRGEYPGVPCEFLEEGESP